MNTTPATDALTEVAPLTMIDCYLTDLEAASRLLGHLSTTDLEIGGSELLAVQVMVDNAHDKIEVCYNRARAEAGHTNA
jgi:hypothetical protein